MNEVIKFELPAEDMKRAGSFYKEVFGWNISEFSDEYLSADSTEVDSMHMSKKVGVINGGIQKRSSRAKSPTVVIQVSDLDGVISKIKARGGKIVVEKETMEGMGHYAQFDDSEGNRIGLFQKI